MLFVSLQRPADPVNVPALSAHLIAVESDVCCPPHDVVEELRVELYTVCPWSVLEPLNDGHSGLGPIHPDEDPIADDQDSLIWNVRVADREVLRVLHQHRPLIGMTSDRVSQTVIAHRGCTEGHQSLTGSYRDRVCSITHVVELLVGSLRHGEPADEVVQSTLITEASQGQSVEAEADAKHRNVVLQAVAQQLRNRVVREIDLTEHLAGAADEEASRVMPPSR